jgi:heat shock protein HslJ
VRPLFSAFAAGLALAACAGSPPTGFEADLPGTTWTVERVVDADGVVQRTDGGSVTFAADGALTLSSCNTCGGRYAVRGDELRVEAPLACTRRACLPGALELERYFAGPLELRREGAYLIAGPVGEVEGPQVHLVPAGDDAP